MEVFEHFTLLKRLYDTLLRPVTRQYSLTRMELDILLFLANNPVYDTARDIVQVRVLSKSQVSMSLETLAARAYLRAECAENNRKVQHLHLLPAADDAVRDGRAAQASFRAVLSRGISADEQAAFAQLNERVANNIRTYLKEGTSKC